VVRAWRADVRSCVGGGVLTWRGEGWIAFGEDFSGVGHERSAGARKGMSRCG